MTIKGFDTNYFFLDPTYPCGFSYGGEICTNVYAAIASTFSKTAREKNRVSHMDAYSALEYIPKPFAVKAETLNAILRAKFSKEEEFMFDELMHSTDRNTTFIYLNDIHDNVLGICTCDRCRSKGIKGYNLLGRIMHDIRKEHN